MPRSLVLSVFGLLLASPVLHAQSVGRMLADDFTWAARDMGAIFVSPAKGSARDWLTAGAVLAGSALLSTQDDEVDQWALANRDRGLLKALAPVRAGGDFYSLNQGTPYVLGLYTVGLITKHRGIRDGIMGCASAYTANTVVRHQIVYRLIGRDRPDTVRDRPEGAAGPAAIHGDQYEFSLPAEGWATHSFPGGHVATMATCASFFAHRYDAKYLDPALIALVAAMGVGRIADRGHWLSDQTVGIAFGYAVGREVARRQLRRLAKERGEKSSQAPVHAPLIETASEGMRLGWQVTY